MKSPRLPCYCVFLSIIVLIITIDSESKHFHTIAGPARFVVKRVSVCDPASYDSDFKLYMKDARTNYTQSLAYYGNVTMPFYLNDTLGGRATMASWSNVAGWRENAFIFNFKSGLCSAGINILVKPTWDALMKSIFGDSTECPLFPGVYRFEAVNTDVFNVIPIQQFMYGRYRVVGKIMDGKRSMSCVIGVIEAVPI